MRNQHPWLNRREEWRLEASTEVEEDQPSASNLSTFDFNVQ